MKRWNSLACGLQRELQRTKEMLREHEWDDLDCCRAAKCLGQKGVLPHEEDCWYAALLSRLRTNGKEESHE